jgi:K(+)-stimulated pyrophosphate-energized sodium pump
LTDSFLSMAKAMLVAIGLVYLLLVPLVTFVALPLVVIAAFVALDVIGHATNIITGLAVSLQATVLPVTVIAAGIWIAYSAGDGIYDAAVVATALLTILPILPIFSISTSAMDSFVNLA